MKIDRAKLSDLGNKAVFSSNKNNLESESFYLSQKKDQLSIRKKMHPCFNSGVSKKY